MTLVRKGIITTKGFHAGYLAMNLRYFSLSTGCCLGLAQVRLFIGWNPVKLLECSGGSSVMTLPMDLGMSLLLNMLCAIFTVSKRIQFLYTQNVIPARDPKQCGGGGG